MSADLTVWLIRHPVPEVPPGICYGQSEIGIAEPISGALARVEAAGCHPATLAQVFSSPWARCRRLAEALSASLVFDTRLSEMNFGHWEGQPWDSIERAAIDEWAVDPLGFAPPGGESARDMATRVVSFATDLSRQFRAMVAQNTPCQIAIVAHHGPLRILQAHWRDEPESVWLTRNFGYATPVPLILDAVTLRSTEKR